MNPCGFRGFSIGEIRLREGSGDDSFCSFTRATGMMQKGFGLRFGHSVNHVVSCTDSFTESQAYFLDFAI